jgi:hypothetical protein
MPIFSGKTGSHVDIRPSRPRASLPASESRRVGRSGIQTRSRRGAFRQANQSSAEQQLLD